MGTGVDAPVSSGRSNRAIPQHKASFGGKGHAVCELQRLDFNNSQEGIRLAREFWEILRRKKGCAVSRLYRSVHDESRWLAYSEWENLAELAGARREAARSPLNRRLHSTLKSSSERAFEPFGPVHSTHGVNFATAPTAMLISFAKEMDEPETSLASLVEAPGYISHILMHEVGKPKTVVCFAHFENLQAAEQAAQTRSQEPTVHDFQPVAELFTV
jgi:quinol monooxygenase YgiN